MKFKDQLNRTIILNNYATKIISLVPSQTELLFDLGLDVEVIGITKFCTHPTSWFKTKIRVGGTKNININKITELQPDLIIANKEENKQADIDAIMQIAPVYISDIKTLEDAITMIDDIGIITNSSLNAIRLIELINIGFNNLKHRISQLNLTPKQTCCYLIWQNPYMSVGYDTFIHNMLEYCGFKNVFSNKERYPTINLNDIIEAQPNLVFLSSEPYPFKKKHITALEQLLPQTKVMLVDGEMFSWYGSRLIKAAPYFADLMEKVNE